MTAEISRLVAALLTMLALSACAVGPNFHSPKPPDTEHYTRAPQPTETVGTPGAGGAAGAAQTFSADRNIPADWWTLFHSPSLDELMRQALNDSPTVQSAQATLLNARETYRAERGALLFPGVDANIQAQRQSEPGALLGQPQITELIYNLFGATLNVSYRLDLFGASRRQLETFAAQSDYQRFELEAARLSLADNVVTTAVNIASLHAQIAALTDIIASERTQLKVVRAQFDAGGASRADLLTQQSQLATNEAQLPALEKALAQAQHRLAVLAGRTPDDATVPDFTMEQLSLPEELPLSVPAQLVRQRPDVQAAEALLHASMAQLGVATANMYPQLNLTGSIGTEALGYQQLFKQSSFVWSLGANLTQPIFHGGELLYQKRAARANLERATADYRQAVLLALEDVADTLRALEGDARVLQANTTAESDAREALNIVKMQYQAGGVSYLALLISQRQYQLAVESRVQAQATRYADTAALYQALGGGWWNRENAKENRP
jgi:NodT family efflux transporter outer membrane factor (OMF) lipoprotein